MLGSLLNENALGSKAGGDILGLQRILGHASITMTMRYAHLASHDLDMCVPVLERAAAC